MSYKDNSQKLGTLPLTVQKILRKILETKDAFVFRPENALDFYNILKMDLLKISLIHIFWKLRLYSEDCILLLTNSKEKVVLT